MPCPGEGTNVEGDRGAGAREKRGGKQEERGWEAGFSRWREPGENERNVVTFHYILQWAWNKQERKATERGGRQE